MNNQSSLLNFFDQSYVINLPERTDRRQGMQKELIRLGGKLALDKVVFFPAIKPVDQGDFPSIGARGCFLSHLEVLKQAKQQNLNHLLIMEDDLSFTPFLRKNQEIVVRELQKLNWDFAYFGHSIDVNSKGNQLFCEYSDSIRLAHFFAVNKNTIFQLVDFLELVLSRPPGHPEGGPMHVDGAYSTFRKQNSDIITLIAQPSLGFQRSSPSSIAGYQWYDQAPGLNNLVGTFRQLKNWYRSRY